MSFITITPSLAHIFWSEGDHVQFKPNELSRCPFRNSRKWLRTEATWHGAFQNIPSLCHPSLCATSEPQDQSSLLEHRQSRDRRPISEFHSGDTLNTRFVALSLCGECASFPAKGHAPCVMSFVEGECHSSLLFICRFRTLRFWQFD